MQQGVLAVAVGHAGFEEVVGGEAGSGKEASGHDMRVGCGDGHAGGDEKEYEEVVAPEREHERLRNVRGAGEDRAMHVGPNGASGTQKNKQPPQQACAALAFVEPGRESAVWLQLKREHERGPLQPPYAPKSEFAIEGLPREMFG